MFHAPANPGQSGIAIPPIDTAAPERLEYARFAMG